MWLSFGSPNNSKTVVVAFILKTGKKLKPSDLLGLKVGPTRFVLLHPAQVTRRFQARARCRVAPSITEVIRAAAVAF
jgi:hypothetical protein